MRGRATNNRERAATDRRRDRTANPLGALERWLQACRADSVVGDLVLFDLDGLCLASTTDDGHAIAAECANIGRKVQHYEGTVDIEKTPRNLRLRRFHHIGEPLVLCGIGGKAGEGKARRLDRSIRGVSRILK